MNQRIKVITLGVSDLERSLAFYRDGLGLATEGIIGTEFEDGAVVFFDMNDDLILALYPKVALAKDANVSMSPPSPSEFSIGHIVKSKQEVDAVMQQAERAGARITDPAHDRFGVGTPDISRTLTATCGKSPGILRGKLRNSVVESILRRLVAIYTTSMGRVLAGEHPVDSGRRKG